MGKLLRSLLNWLFRRKAAVSASSLPAETPGVRSRFSKEVEDQAEALMSMNRKDRRKYGKMFKTRIPSIMHHAAFRDKNKQL